MSYFWGCLRLECPYAKGGIVFRSVGVFDVIVLVRMLLKEVDIQEAGGDCVMGALARHRTFSR